MTRDRETTHPAADAELLQRYLDGELAAREVARLDAHLAACRSCADEVRAFRALFAAVAALPPRRPSPFLAGRILAAVEAERPRLRRPRWLEAAGAAYASAAATLLIALGLSPWRDGLVEGLRSFFSLLLTGSVNAVVGAADQAVELLTLLAHVRERAGQALMVFAPVWRSLELLAAQPELRVGLSLALVLSTGLLWMVHRPARGTGRIRDASAFL